MSVFSSQPSVNRNYWDALRWNKTKLTDQIAWAHFVLCDSKLSETLKLVNGCQLNMALKGQKVQKNCRHKNHFSEWNYWRIQVSQISLIAMLLHIGITHRHKSDREMECNKKWNRIGKKLETAQMQQQQIKHKKMWWKGKMGDNFQVHSK